jgi:hypothetical protein
MLSLIVVAALVAVVLGWVLTSSLREPRTARLVMPARPWTADEADEARKRLRTAQANDLLAVYGAEREGLPVPKPLLELLEEKHREHLAELELIAAADRALPVGGGANV